LGVAYRTHQSETSNKCCWCLPQSCLGQYLVRWVAGCSAGALRLKLKEDFATGCFFDLTVVNAGIQGALGV